MSDSNLNPDPVRFASAAKLVNRRTELSKQTAQPSSVPLAVQQKLARHQAQYLLGQPLSQQLKSAKAPHSAGYKFTTILALGCAFTGMGLLIAWLQASIGSAVAVLLFGLFSTGGMLVHLRRKMARNTANFAVVDTAFESAALAALDQVLHQFTAEVPAPMLPPLAALKQTLIRIAPLLERSVVNEVFTQEDRFYVGECVRRYLPDTLQAYLQVPAQQRAIPGSDGHSANALLIAQIKTLQTELSQRETLLVQQANEALLQQQRFLQAKHKN